MPISLHLKRYLRKEYRDWLADYFDLSAGRNSGGIYVADGATVQTSITDTPVKVTGFAANMPSNTITPDHTADTLTVGQTGRYHVSANMSFTGSINEVFTFEIYIGGVASGLKCERKISSADVGSTSVSGLVDAIEGDAIELRVNSDGTSVSLTLVQAQLVAEAA